MSEELAAWIRRCFPMLDAEHEVRQLDPEFRADRRRVVLRERAEQERAAELEARYQRELQERMRANAVAYAKRQAEWAELHRQQRESAQKAAETLARRRAAPGYLPPSPGRTAAIMAFREAGETLQAIGDRIGISANRVRHVIVKEDRLRKQREAAKEESDRRIAAAEMAHRQRKTVILVGVEPVADWRTPEQEWDEIAAGR